MSIEKHLSKLRSQARKAVSSKAVGRYAAVSGIVEKSGIRAGTVTAIAAVDKAMQAGAEDLTCKEFTVLEEIRASLVAINADFDNLADALCERPIESAKDIEALTRPLAERLLSACDKLLALKGERKR